MKIFFQTRIKTYNRLDDPWPCSGCNRFPKRLWVWMFLKAGSWVFYSERKQSVPLCQQCEQDRRRSLYYERHAHPIMN